MMLSPGPPPPESSWPDPLKAAAEDDVVDGRLPLLGAAAELQRGGEPDRLLHRQEPEQLVVLHRGGDRRRRTPTLARKIPLLLDC